MPPSGADAGLIFLQHVIEYAETVLFPGGCTCGSSPDFTIEAEQGRLPDGTQGVAFYVVECVACHRRTRVEADVLENFSAAAWQGQPLPGTPPEMATCTTCGQEAPKYLMLRHTAADGQRQCPACATVADKIGEIVDVTAGESIL